MPQKKRTTYIEIVNAFAEHECKLLTTEDEFLKMVENQKSIKKKANIGWLKFKFIAQCKHENEVFFNDFTRKHSGILCKPCRYAQMAENKRQEVKLSPIVSNNVIIEHEGYKICKEFLNNDFEIYTTNNCCLADFIIKPIDVLENKYLGVQLKVCIKSVNGTYAFSRLNKGYQDLAIVCVCIAEKKIWVFDHNDLQGKNRLSIGRSKEEYNKFLIPLDEFNKCCRKFYDYKPQFTKEQLMIPLTLKCKVEHEYRVRRENELGFISFENVEIDNAIFDFIINGKKHQEKVASFRRRNGVVTKTYLVPICKWNHTYNKKTSYDKGDNDFYWVWLRDTTIFFVFPEKILIDKNIIGIQIQSSLSFNLNVKDWKQDYLFDLHDLDKDKLTSLIGLDVICHDKVVIPQMIIPDPEPVIIREKKQTLCIDCNTEIYSGSTRCVSCNSKTNRKVERPPKDVLLKMIAESNYVQVGKKFGVSDNAIRNWLRRY